MKTSKNNIGKIINKNTTNTFEVKNNKSNRVNLSKQEEKLKSKLIKEIDVLIG